MDIIQISNKYLNALYLKSKTNFDKGYNESAITNLIGLDKNQAQDIMKYLSEKGLIDTESGYGGSIKLKANGIDYILELRKNKIFKTLKFRNVTYIPSTRDAIEFLYKYNIADEAGNSEAKTIKVSISGSLSINWGFQIWSLQPDKDYPNLAKILLQYAKDRIIEKLKDGTLTDSEELILLSSTHPTTVPYNPDDLVDVSNAEYEIEVGQKMLKENIEANKLAASIIETRDVINNIFYEKHGEKLLLLTEERNLLDFFKTAKTPEEFSHRLTSLGHTARHMNVSILRKLTNETNKDVGSVGLLENFLHSVDQPNKYITDCLKQIGRIRQGYPVHTDVAGVIKGYQYFGLQYPVEDFETAWTTLLNHYLTSLKRLYAVIVDIYLT